MAPFSIPAPSIIPLRLPVFGGPKSIDTHTKIQLLCETFLEHEIFYTLDGTKPQPYAGIVQGNKTIKYECPFCLPSGKITIKAIAINANIHTMCSNIVTKCFEVLPVESDSSSRKKTPSKESSVAVSSRRSKCQEGTCVKNKLNSRNLDCNQNSIGCLEKAFIETLDVEQKDNLSAECDDNVSTFPSVGSFDSDCSDHSSSVVEFELGQSSTVLSEDTNLELKDVDGESLSESQYETCKKDLERKSFDVPEAVSNVVYGQSDATQFCCLKCDMTLQQCSSCNKMNAVSAKFCIECGTQLIRVCAMCQQHNPSIAVFCQYCGQKLVSAAMKLDFSTGSSSHSKVDHSVMCKPKSKNASIQKLPVCVDKGTQTEAVSEKVSNKKSPSRRERKDLPSHSPGRGYWRLQVDYICNHLKTHAYNDLEFRKVISEPSLCHFKSAHVTKDDENVTVTVVFSPFTNNQCSSKESGGSKNKESP